MLNIASTCSNVEFDDGTVGGGVASIRDHGGEFYHPPSPPLGGILESLSHAQHPLDVFSGEFWVS